MLVNRSPFPVLLTSVGYPHKQLHQEKTLLCSFIRDTALDDTSYCCEKIEENHRSMTKTRSNFTPVGRLGDISICWHVSYVFDSVKRPTCRHFTGQSTLNLNFHGNGNFDSDFTAITLVMEEFFFHIIVLIGERFSEVVQNIWKAAFTCIFRHCKQ